MSADEAFAAADRSRRYHRIERLIVVALVVVLTVAAAITVVLGARQNEIRELIARQECTARISAQFQGAVALAFASQPAPNPDRAEAVAAINRAAEKLRNLDEVCPT